MHERERHKLILKTLSERGIVMFRELTALLGASEPTVRSRHYVTVSTSWLQLQAAYWTSCNSVLQN